MQKVANDARSQAQVLDGTGNYPVVFKLPFYFRYWIKNRDCCQHLRNFQLSFPEIKGMAMAWWPRCVWGQQSQASHRGDKKLSCALAFPALSSRAFISNLVCFDAHNSHFLLKIQSPMLHWTKFPFPPSYPPIPPHPKSCFPHPQLSILRPHKIPLLLLAPSSNEIHYKHSSSSSVNTVDSWLPRAAPRRAGTLHQIWTRFAQLWRCPIFQQGKVSSISELYLFSLSFLSKAFVLRAGIRQWSIEAFLLPRAGQIRARNLQEMGKGRIFCFLNNLCTELQPDIFSRTNLSVLEGLVWLRG